jgi:hypothetical protein
LDQVALDQSGHSARPAAAAPQLGAVDRDDLDAVMALAGLVSTLRS